MAVIAVLKPTKAGGWEGTIRTFSNSLKVRFVPNDNRQSDAAPDFHIVAAQSEVGAAWKRRKADSEYLSVEFDDPTLPRPIAAALFYSTDAAHASLVWRRDDDR